MASYVRFLIIDRFEYVLLCYFLENIILEYSILLSLQEYWRKNFADQY
jgi:hypothetical protein